MGGAFSAAEILAELYFDIMNVKPEEPTWEGREKKHPDMHKTPGVDFSTGSLGQGTSIAAGIALAGKMDNSNYRVFALTGDGELQEEQVWEAALFALQYNLYNFALVYINSVFVSLAADLY